MTQTKKTAPKLKAEIVQAVDKEQTVSGKIRVLNRHNVPTADISRFLTEHLGKYVRYQWVRNVLHDERMKRSTVPTNS